MRVAWWASPLLAIAAITTTLGGCQQGDAAPRSATAPMQIVNSRPVVDAVVVSADGKLHRVRLLVDTRDRGVVLTTGAAKRAGLQRGAVTTTAEGTYAPVDAEAVRLGATRLETGGDEVLVAVESDDEALAGVDGLIGARVLQRYGRVTLNFPEGRIVLGEPADAPVLGRVVPTRYEDGEFVARITLGTVTRRLLVATSSVTTHVREDGPIRITGTRRGVWGKVVLAPFEVVGDPDVTAPADGLLGANLLSRYTVRIDYDRGTFRVSTT